LLLVESDDKKSYSSFMDIILIGRQERQGHHAEF